MKNMQKLFSNTFISATIWMYFATGILLFGNYLYHLIVIRLITSKSAFGEFESAFAFIYLFSAPLMTVSLIVIKMVSHYKGKGETEKIGALFYYLNQKIAIIGIALAALILLFSPLIMEFLHLSSHFIILLVAVSMLAGFYNMFGKSVLQGMFKFHALAITNTLEVIAKIGLSALLIIAGFQSSGALVGFAISLLLGYFVARFYISKDKFKRTIFADKKSLFKVSFPVFITTAALTSFYTTDILLVRYFFPGSESGDYAALSLMGKIIIFGVAPITTVMFPLVSEHHAKGAKYNHFLLISLLLTAFGASAVILMYFLFPIVMIRLLPGTAYIPVAPMLGYFGIFMGLYTLCFVMANFFLSISRHGVAAIVVAAALLQVVLVYFFHESLFQVIQIGIVVTFVLLLSLLLYYAYISSEFSMKKANEKK
jgi:O-antigen/teichoic acid export membrane protein